MSSTTASTTSSASTSSTSLKPHQIPGWSQYLVYQWQWQILQEEKEEAALAVNQFEGHWLFEKEKELRVRELEQQEEMLWRRAFVLDFGPSLIACVVWLRVNHEVSPQSAVASYADGYDGLWPLEGVMWSSLEPSAWFLYCNGTLQASRLTCSVGQVDDDEDEDDN